MVRRSVAPSSRKWKQPSVAAQPTSSTKASAWVLPPSGSGAGSAMRRSRSFSRRSSTGHNNPSSVRNLWPGVTSASRPATVRWNIGPSYRSRNTSRTGDHTSRSPSHDRIVSAVVISSPRSHPRWVRASVASSTQYPRLLARSP